MRNLSDCRLYGIVDLGYVEVSDVLRVTEAMIDGGVDVIQLRGKSHPVEELSRLAAALHGLTSPAGVPLIANDHVELARHVPLEGVHVGQEDQSVAEVRAQAGRAILVGKSTHSPAQALQAEKEGPDYIGFGPLFATPTKPDYQPIGLRDIVSVHRSVGLPVFCIGGIKLENLEQVLGAGAQRVVIVSGLLQATKIADYARQVKSLLTSGR